MSACWYKHATHKHISVDTIGASFSLSLLYIIVSLSAHAGFMYARRTNASVSARHMELVGAGSTSSFRVCLTSAPRFHGDINVAPPLVHLFCHHQSWRRILHVRNICF